VKQAGRGLGSRALRSATCTVAVLLSACGAPTPAEAGLGAFLDPSVSTSPLNRWSCATCHTVGVRTAPRIDETREGPLLPGADLAQAPLRGGWWGGDRKRLLDAMNVCVRDFMGGAPLTSDDQRARALEAYLLSVPGTPAPWPLTIVKNVDALDGRAGDASRGRDAYRRACAGCHGAPHTGEGRSDVRTSIVPEDTLRAFPNEARAVVVEKVRHGRYFNIGGRMPPYSLEALGDGDLADILAFLGL
jgi:thiosulfate dehydrogenase